MSSGDPFGSDPFACPRLERANHRAWRAAGALDDAADAATATAAMTASAETAVAIGSMGSTLNAANAAALDAESVISLGSSSTGRRLWVSGNTGHNVR